MLPPLTARAFAACLFLLTSAVTSAWAQTYSSGSTGADGALTFPANAGVVVFKPQERGFDLDRDHVFHFTTVNVPAGTTVRMAADVFDEGRPVHWLASGGVVIDGVLDLNGGNGHPGTDLAKPSVPGAGGYAGGSGGKLSQLARFGGGPGGGRTGGSRDMHGGSAGFLVNATSGETRTASPGTAYAAPSLLPIVGGSGGAGGDLSGVGGLDGAGGGAGGGAILIASSTSIAFNGAITARGGDGGSGPRNFGGGSGGAVRMVAPVITGAGSIDVQGGRAPAPLTLNVASAGRVRLEALDQKFIGSVLPSAASLSFGSPSPALLPATGPRIRVARIGGVAVPENPLGSLLIPDLTVDFSQLVAFELEGANVPLGTRINVNIVYEDGTTGSLQSGGLTGTLERSTASTVATRIPHGIARVFLTAGW